MWIRQKLIKSKEYQLIKTVKMTIRTELIRCATEAQKWMLTRSLFTGVIAVCIFIFFGTISAEGQSVQNASTPFTGEKTSWHGFDRYDFIMDAETLTIIPFKSSEGEASGVGDPANEQRRCIVIVPKIAATGNPWSWRGCYWDHQPQTEVELLNRGFHIAYISANQDLKPGKQWDAWYDFLTQKHGLSTKPAFIGMSRGGEYSYIWATTHPNKVSCIYADNPGSNWGIMNGLSGLALNDVPLLHVCGSIDPIFGKFSLTIENVYQQSGGRISMMIKEGFGHHPHSLRDPKIIADFIEQSVKETKVTPPEFVGERFTRRSYYSIASSIRNFPSEGAYITCRGPLFTECYNRYEIEITNVDAFITIIEPKIAAPGKPWVFRSDFVNLDAVVDQALLAKGFYIVTGAVPYNADGPVLTQWNTIYKYLTDHGFSKKPVMEGCGGATGEAYAWAIENPDKVSCIYGENPVLHSNLAKIQPIDNLAPLARAGIPILHFCGSLDPFFNNNTREAEKRYKELGGKITVIVKEGEGHSSLTLKDSKPVVDFITGNVQTKFSKGPYYFDGSISREVLENYLDRSVTMGYFLVPGTPEGYQLPYKHDDIRMIKNMGAKFIGRAIYRWSEESKLNDTGFLAYAKAMIDTVHAFDPDVIFQGCLFESVTKDVNNLKIPAWVFTDLGLPVENRTFSCDSMIKRKGSVSTRMGGGGVPIINNRETQLWFFYLAATYINIGCEAFHLGQVGLIGADDKDLKVYSEFLAKIRAYAKEHARRHYIILDGHVPTGGMVKDGVSLLDFNSFPLRIKPMPGRPYEAKLQVGYLDAIFKRSKGCISPSGWKCESLPFLVEFDNFGKAKITNVADTTNIFIWGWDEISWFSLQKEQDRNNWLVYAWNWIRKTDPNGHLEMPGTRMITCPNETLRTYFANTKSTDCPVGYSQEETIKKIWEINIK